MQTQDKYIRIHEKEKIDYIGDSLGYLYLTGQYVSKDGTTVQDLSPSMTRIFEDVQSVKHTVGKQSDDSLLMFMKLLVEGMKEKYPKAKIATGTFEELKIEGETDLPYHNLQYKLEKYLPPYTVT